MSTPATRSRVSSAAGNEACFGQRAPCPGKGLPIPARERHDGDALAVRMDHPASAQVNPGVIDGGRLRARARRAEEDDVARGELCEADPLRTRHLAAHLVRGPPPDGRVQGGASRIRLQLVPPPDEAGAVETAACLDPEGRFGGLVRAAPDVRVADEADGRVEDALLPGAELRQREGVGGVLGVLWLPAAKAQDL